MRRHNVNVAHKHISIHLHVTEQKNGKKKKQGLSKVKIIEETDEAKKQEMWGMDQMWQRRESMHKL